MEELQSAMTKLVKLQLKQQERQQCIEELVGGHVILVCKFGPPKFNVNEVYLIGLEKR